MSGKKSMSNIFVIVGGENSGKDEVIRAVYELGGFHAQIIPKFTSRMRQVDDGREIRCNYLFEKQDKEDTYIIRSQEDEKEYECDIVYKKNDNSYGIDSHQIWEGLRKNKFQVIVASEIEAINILKRKFGTLVKLIFIHAQTETEESPEFNLFINNFNAFDHVLIYESKKEDLYDQLFRLFRAYE